MAQIWVVEDNRKIRANMLFQLQTAGYATTGLSSAEEAAEKLNRPLPPDLLLLDVRLEGKSGVDLVRELSQKQRLPPTIIVSGEASISETVEALKYGVYDFIEKPVSQQRLLQSVANCLEVNALKKHIKSLKAKVHNGTTLLGRSPSIELLREQIKKVAPTQSRVLIRGKSGTGKELVAACIHEASTRQNGPFVRINCAAIPKHLIEDELFGHVKGAFTDARADKKGLFEQAHQGTLFLDEIGDMAPQLQPRLLRVLEDHQVRRLGDTRNRPVDVRIVAATHCDLEDLIAKNQFREDLYFRMATIPLHVPPLHQRKEDIPMLFTHFVEQSCRSNNLPRRTVDPGAFAVMKQYSWPGNVRELKNIAERTVIFGGDPITADQLPGSLSNGSALEPSGLLQVDRLMGVIHLRDFKARCEKEYLELVLQKTNWNVSEAAKLIGIQRPHLHQKLNQLKLFRPKPI